MPAGRKAWCLVVAALACAMALVHSGHAQDGDDAAALNAEVERLYQAGKYAEAGEVARRSLALSEKVRGPEHPEVALSLNNLALMYQVQGRFAEAEPLYQRSLAIREKALGPDHLHVGISLNNLAGLYQDTGRYAEAVPLLERSLAITEKALGPDHPRVAIPLNNLAGSFKNQGHYADAEPLLKRSRAIEEKALGPDHPQIATTLNNLASLYDTQGRYAEAEPLYTRGLAIEEMALGPDHPRVATTLNNLAALYRTQGRYAEAEPAYKRSLAIWEKALGPQHPDVGTALHNLAWLYFDQGRYAEAEPLFKRSLAITEKALGPEHPSVATSLNGLGGLYQDQGRYAEAEPLYRRSLAISEKALGPEHPGVGKALNNLAALYKGLGRSVEAEPLYKRSLAIGEKRLGPDHIEVATALHNLALLYTDQGRHAEAERLLKRGLAILQKALGPEHPDVALSLNALARLYADQGRYAEAEALYKRSLAIREEALGPDHADVGVALNNLAELHRVRGHATEAKLLFERSLAVWETALGPDHPSVGTALNNLAVLSLAQRDWALAADYWRRSTGIIKRRSGRLASGPGQASSGEAQRSSWDFWGLIKATYRLADKRPTAPQAAEMFEAAQWAQASDAAASLAQMAARSATGSPQLAGVVRERQDLVGEWQVKDKLLITAKSEPPARRKAEAETALADRLAAIDARLAEIDRRLAREYPDYAALARPAPLPVAEVQALLHADEALVLFLDTDGRVGSVLPEETFVWGVTKSDVRLVRTGLGTPALARAVTALRCGLDAAGWDGAAADRCARALDITPAQRPGSGQPLPFDHGVAFKLYRELFGEVRDLIAGKHLLIVPSGPLTQLPFQVLVTAPPPPLRDDHRAAPWLARAHAVTVLPAVSSLKALRRVGRPSAAPRPMIGFGNPLLDGPDHRYAGVARLAREKQRCPEMRSQRVAAIVGARGGIGRVETTGGLADLAHLKMQAPLPETVDELCAVAQDVKAGPNDIRLGAEATEREVKRLSLSGELAKYRMVHFATHGALAGELDGTREPGLILTPPESASAEDDGYLSASEIAGLKLDADWVILSACNTAAGSAVNAEALSGLARAFIYAQARALLVSHWAVDSDAAVKLITGAVGAMARDARVGRAEALRRAMLARIDTGDPQEAHPASWAPFVLVGEGASVR